MGSQRISVTFEVILGVQRLIKLNGTNMSEPSWDVICEILTATESNLRFYGKKTHFIKVEIVNLKKNIHRENQCSSQGSYRTACFSRDTDSH